MKLSLNLKVSLFVAVIVFLSAVISTWQLVTAQKNSLEKALMARADTLSEALGRAINEGLAQENLNLIKQVEDIVHTTDVNLVQAFSPLWLGVASVPAGKHNYPPSPAAVEHFKKHHNEHDHFIDREGSYLDVYHAVYLDLHDPRIPKIIVGYVRLMISTTAVEKEIRSTIIRSLFLSAAVTMMILSILFVFMQKLVLKPVGLLHESIVRYRNGEAVSIPGLHAYADDELGEVAREFSLLTTAIDMQTDQIKKQLEELEMKNAELERFTYTVSHDLKSPLITIKGFIGSLVPDARAGKFERMEGDVARIANAADKMKNLLDGLLELSRIGRMVNPSVWFSMTEAAKEAAEMLQGTIRGKHMKLSITEGMPEVFADRQRIVEVFQNLIENAIKYMGTQSAPEIEAGVRMTPDGFTAFYVSDNGMGIDSQFFEKIFGLFDKLNSMSEGTGIGLAIVKRIVQLHGGKIWVESKGRGEGTTFLFTLPLPDKEG